VRRSECDSERAGEGSRKQAKTRQDVFIQFKTIENRPVAINPVYVVFMTPGKDAGTTHIQVTNGIAIQVVGDYPLVLEKMKLGAQDQSEEDEDDQY
jgi:hypothetical protein